MSNFSFSNLIQFSQQTVFFTNTWRPLALGETDSGSSRQYLICICDVNISNSPPQIPWKDFLGVGVGRSDSLAGVGKLRSWPARALGW